MRPTPTKALTACAALAAALALGACGNNVSSIRGGETEGVYLTVGQLKYQVELSRQLNPRAIPEDSSFVADVAPAEARLAPDELWFAVFVRVENDTKHPVRPATDYTITDTEGNVFRPVSIGAGNPFRYMDIPVPRHGVLPNPAGIAGQLGSINGMMLLFKLKRDTLDNRPLVLTIRSASPADHATDVLDV